MLIGHKYQKHYSFSIEMKLSLCIFLICIIPFLHKIDRAVILFSVFLQIWKLLFAYNDYDDSGKVGLGLISVVGQFSVICKTLSLIPSAASKDKNPKPNKQNIAFKKLIDIMVVYACNPTFRKSVSLRLTLATYTETCL